MLNFINRTILSNKYVNAKTGTYFPRICQEDLTRIIGQCPNTNKKIKNIIVELSLTTYFSNTQYIINKLNFNLDIYYYDPIGQLKILKSQPQTFNSPNCVGKVIQSQPYNSQCRIQYCNADLRQPYNACSGTAQFGYTAKTCGGYDITIFAISCGVESGGVFFLYIMIDKFRDPAGNIMSGWGWVWQNLFNGLGNKFASLTIGCPSVVNGPYGIIWGQIGGGTIVTCIPDTPQITNITLVQQ